MTKKGFTLAEILITLGIIGIVAALTIPQLMHNYRAKKMRSQFDKTYSILNQAIKTMQSDDVSIDFIDYPTATFYKTFIKYFNGATLCGTSSQTYSGGDICYDFKNPQSYYKNFHNGLNINYPNNYIDDGQFILQDGTQIYIENYTNYDRLYISADLNGYKHAPNRWGYDLFTFQYIDDELKPMGDNGTDFTNKDLYCDKNSSSYANGMACANLAKSAPDYFKKLKW
ncbi:prepilin-type N-terminal cleavage/methylation domain-containing protein [bacterium]|nr:prepilin-type N-terminal cleavage/methylation domain-containing protein [bacterium]